MLRPERTVVIELERNVAARFRRSGEPMWSMCRGYRHGTSGRAFVLTTTDIRTGSVVGAGTTQASRGSIGGTRIRFARE